MTEAEFEDALKMAQAARIAYERGLIPEDKWSEIMALAKLYVKTARLTETLNDDVVLSAEVIDG